MMGVSSFSNRCAPFLWETRILFGIFPIALCATFCLAGCEKSSPAKGGKNSKASTYPKVVVTKPIWDKVMDYQDFTGRLDAVKSVEIRARVSGYLTKAIQARDAKVGPHTITRKDGVPIREGDIVRNDDPLFEIDPRPYKATWDRTVATVKQTEATLGRLTKEYKRAEALFKQPTKGISQQEFDKAESDMKENAAALEVAKANQESAKINLDFTLVKAPFSGMVSRRFMDPGTLVNADTTVLTTIVSENPIYAYFDVDERTYLDLLKLVAPGKKSWFEGLEFPVMMRLANEDDFKKDKVGVVDFVDNRVVASTGTVRMRGVFQNPSGQLKAGLFVRIRLPVGSAYKTILIPDEAIQSDQERKYVWIVNAKNKVEYRSVKLGQSIKELRAILPPDKGMESKEGLSDKDRVIIGGMQRVRHDIQVEPEEHDPPAPPEMPLVRLLNQAGTK
jgi:multidrug efflux system membrane fusion protein